MPQLGIILGDLMPLNLGYTGMPSSFTMISRQFFKIPPTPPTLSQIPYTNHCFTVFVFPLFRVHQKLKSSECARVHVDDFFIQTLIAFLIILLRINMHFIRCHIDIYFFLLD